MLGRWVDLIAGGEISLGFFLVLSFFESGQFKGRRELPGNLIYCLECAEVVLKLIGK
ncbi:hypothetical protein F2Q69_00047562 [Brassica cretica]|uniref:Uncharacterized protein n=1 Tax=Brassica cretica TaxID=69181 RepID=A0A8S9PTR7_BRACR|nr:hypothetical protein F2Q69_00047562 [Brassica cretica]